MVIAWPTRLFARTRCFAVRELLGLYVVLRTSKTTVDSKDRSVFQTGATRLEPFIMCGEGGPEGAGKGGRGGTSGSGHRRSVAAPPGSGVSGGSSRRVSCTTAGSASSCGSAARQCLVMKSGTTSHLHLHPHLHLAVRAPGKGPAV